MSAIIAMQEQMVETAGWKACRGLEVMSDRCRLCKEKKETVYHWLSGCKKLAGNEYVKRHNKALMILCVEWSKVHGLMPEEAIWYKENWKQGHILENDEMKLSWDFEYAMRATTTARRPDATLEYKYQKQIYIVDMACPHDSNIDGKYQEKISKYQQLAFELRERRPGYRIEVVPIVLGCMGTGVSKLRESINKLIDDETQSKRVIQEMVKTILWEGESIVRKVLSGLAQ